jgi:hypothetical protein
MERRTALRIRGVQVRPVLHEEPGHGGAGHRLESLLHVGACSDEAFHFGGTPGSHGFVQRRVEVLL